MKRRRSWDTSQDQRHFHGDPTKMDTSALQYDSKFPYFREPKEIGHFSLDSDRQFKCDKSQLKTFKPPPNFERCYFDLRKGYDKMILKDDSVKSYINDLLRWIMLHREIFLSPTADEKQFFQSLNTDFICWRGLLTRIMCIPFENREDLRFAVILYRGTYFICQYDTEAKKKREQEMTDRDKEMCAWGWKFEQYVTADTADGSPDTEKPVNNNEEYGVVVRSRLDSHSLVYGAEVDCLNPDDQKGGKYLELKTSRIIESKRQQENFCRFKLIKFWAQSFLIGIRRIVCGFRDDYGVVRSLKNYPVEDLPKLASSTLRNCWSPSVCFNFLNSFLSFVKSTVKEEKCVYVFFWKPGSKLILESKGLDSFYFLPDWFQDWELWDEPISTKLQQTA